MKRKTAVLVVLILITLFIFSSCERISPEEMASSTVSMTVNENEQTTLSSTRTSELSDNNSSSETALSSMDSMTVSDEQSSLYSFRTSELYESHFVKHGAEFGNITKEQYLQMANSLILSKTALTKNEEDGDKIYYDADKNEFLVLSTDGYIRTFFKPDNGLDYYNKQ